MSTSSKQENRQAEIKKHISAIHCSNNISLIQRKLFNALLFNAYHDLPKKSQYTIPVRLLAQLIGYDSNDHKKIKTALMGLITTAIEWNLLDHTNSDFSRWRASAIIASAKIEHGICTYEFSSLMRELLYRPEVYGRIDMNMMARFKSGYGLALYENCIRFQGLPNTGWLSLHVFRKLMGIADDSYLIFCDFKKRVLDIAIREVNQHSDWYVTPELKRVNKKVTNIRFKLEAKKHIMIHVEHPDGQLPALLSTLHKEFGLSLDSSQEILIQYHIAYIQEKITLIKNSSSFQQGKVRDLAAYLIDALKRDYKQSKAKKVKSAAIGAVFQTIQQETHKEDQQRKTYRSYVNARIDDYLNQLADQPRFELFHQFEKSCDSFTLKKYKKYGLHYAAVRALFNVFVKENGLFDQLAILSWEDYLASQC